MKTKNLVNGLVAGLMLVQSSALFAESLRFDESVTVQDTTLGDGNGTVLRAFRSQESCRIWNYIPGRHIASGTLLHDTWTTPVKIGSQNLTGILSAVEIQASPAIAPGHLEQLRDKIVLYLKETQNECKQDVKREQIVLSPALVQTKARTETRPGVRPFYSVTAPTYEHADAVYFDPSNSISITMQTDATNPKTERYIKDVAAKSHAGPIQMGNISYMMNGILNSVDSRLSIKGVMDAEFDSSVKQTSCNVSTGGKNLNGFGAALSLAGGGATAFGLGYSENSTTCTYNLITEMKSGKYKSMVTLDHSRTKLSDNGMPVVIQVCEDRNKCSPVPLEEFINTQLLTLMMMSNFDIIITKLAEGTFNVTLGRKGTVKTEFNMDAAYLRSFHGTLGLDVPVYAFKMREQDLDFSGFKSPMAVCAQGKYEAQVQKFLDFARGSAIPVAAECLNVPGGSN